MKKLTLLSAFTIVIGLATLQNARAEETPEFMACMDKSQVKASKCRLGCMASSESCENKCGSDETCKSNCGLAENNCSKACPQVDPLKICEPYSAYSKKMQGLRSPKTVACFQTCNEKRTNCHRDCEKTEDLCSKTCTSTACKEKCWYSLLSCKTSCLNTKDCFEACKPHSSYSKP